MTTRVVVASCGCEWTCPLPEDVFERFGTGMDRRGLSIRGPGSLTMCPNRHTGRVVRFRMVG